MCSGHRTRMEVQGIGPLRNTRGGPGRWCILEGVGAKVGHKLRDENMLQADLIY